MPTELKNTGPEGDIVISSRVRIARNIQGMAFPQCLEEEDAKAVVERVYNTITSANSYLEEEFNLVEMKDINKIERLNYVEKHLISPALAQRTLKGGVIINHDKTISIMINEEDHIRIQCLLPGLQLQNCIDTAGKIDDLIEADNEYAFDEKLGYLTSCPTNVGTGIRASVMVHLPALTLTGYIKGMIQMASRIGLTVRGIYGEGTEFAGNIYQISNQVTLGVSEEEIITNLNSVTERIIENERSIREDLLKNRNIELEDKVFRSYGILKNARLLSSNESMKLISDVKLGVNLGLINETSIERLNEIVDITQPGYLQKYFNMELTGVERDIKRAQLIRESL